MRRFGGRKEKGTGVGTMVIFRRVSRNPGLKAPSLGRGDARLKPGSFAAALLRRAFDALLWHSEVVKSGWGRRWLLGRVLDALHVALFRRADDEIAASSGWCWWLPGCLGGRGLGLGMARRRMWGMWPRLTIEARRTAVWGRDPA